MWLKIILYDIKLYICIINQVLILVDINRNKKYILKYKRKYRKWSKVMWGQYKLYDGFGVYKIS